MGSKVTYTHARRNGKPVTVRVPRGSTSEPAQFKENVLLSALGRRLGRR